MDNPKADRRACRDAFYISDLAQLAIGMCGIPYGAIVGDFQVSLFGASLAIFAMGRLLCHMERNRNAPHQ
jgi:hypothetical protein